MTVDEVQRESTGGTAPASSPHNRFVLLSVLAFVALVTVFLLKKNMEPPPAADGEAQQPTVADQQPSAAKDAMPDMMAQVAHITDLLAKDSSNYDAWVALGNIYFDANMPEKSIEHYEGALAIRSGDINVMTDLATMKRAVGEAEQAVSILQRVVDKDSTFGQAWFNLGVIYSLDLKDNKSAVSAWKRFIATSPDSPHIEAVRNEIQRLESEMGL